MPCPLCPAAIPRSLCACPSHFHSAGQRFGVMDEFQPAPTAQQHQAQQQQQGDDGGWGAAWEHGCPACVLQWDGIPVRARSAAAVPALLSALNRHLLPDLHSIRTHRGGLCGPARQDGS